RFLVHSSSERFLELLMKFRRGDTNCISLDLVRMPSESGVKHLMVLHTTEETISANVPLDLFYTLIELADERLI
ncbi:MAG: hypothetical protein KDD62_08680, partial [Bdellovibrionales bacterium]|nr:hypothetical protein [Bdellovibrionales bacterium]